MVGATANDPVNDADVVRREYASEDRFLARRLTSWATLDGPLVEDEMIAALRAGVPARLLEVGCGTGDLTERVRREVDAELVAVDLSPRMVELTATRGLDALVADIGALPFDLGSFDAVLANRVLYHLPDLDAGLAEIERVLRPGGRLVSVTYAETHLAELYDLLRDEPAVDADPAEPYRRHFANVEVRSLRGSARFATRADVRGSLDTWGELAWFADLDLDERLAQLPEPFDATYRHVLVVATAPGRSA